MEKDRLKIPELSLVLLIGVSGSGKSTFAKKKFKATEVISSDFCRGLVSDDENDQSATSDAFDLLRFIAAKRLAAGKLTVIDATNVQPEARKSLLHLARKYHCPAVAIVINPPQKICIQRNKSRQDRNFGDHVIKQQSHHLDRSLKFFKKEGFRYIHSLTDPDQIDSCEIVREKLWTDLKHEGGSFDIIGDIHGCFDELSELLEALGYLFEQDTISHPESRRVIFVGDLVDRGPKTPEVLKLVMSMVKEGIAFCVPGNHDIKLMKKLKGRDVKIAHGLQDSLDQLKNEPPEFIQEVVEFIDGLISHYVFDEGKLVVAHAGMKEPYQGRASKAVRAFALFGETTGETDEYGLPVRYPWANEYRGKAMVVYGHTPIPESPWINNTINIDNGCVFGGKLTALRYPEKELVSIAAKKVYAERVKPLTLPENDVQKRREDILDIGDITGKRAISTRFHKYVTIREENTIPALEVMSRFAINPKWLIYLPPTMSPTETSEESDFLEHPKEAFRYYQKQGISKVICQEKHMGSRAIVVVCKTPEAAQRRFGQADKIGVCFTRTGRSFFEDDRLEREFLKRVQTAIAEAKVWETLETDWLCLDCELLPWSAKAHELIKEQYAAVGSSARTSLAMSKQLLQQAININQELTPLHTSVTEKFQMVSDYITAYQRYCWKVSSIEDYQLAPFHILASENALHVEKDHGWHMALIEQLCQADEKLFKRTRYKITDTDDPSNCTEATDWWLQLTEKEGGEGMVVKPFDFTVLGTQGLIQPGIKCRGREYLRIIYGPEYTAPNNLSRLKERNLSRKRSLALREYALGTEALERFVKSEPIYKYHEAVFGVLALESEPVDPRL
ncbi:MAG: polynucleotide kinase-phosphatase [Simkaniaceae bacterium]|nr:polynucleotide kinase-phosphatase [Candidatus Sacchlamyda saccharinae]